VRAAARTVDGGVEAAAAGVGAGPLSFARQYAAMLCA